jgi:hypothetical protein
MTSTDEVKCDRSNAASGPTWMIPATQISTSIGPSSRSVRSTSASTAGASAMSQRAVATVQPAARSCSAPRAKSLSVRAQIIS